MCLRNVQVLKTKSNVKVSVNVRLRYQCVRRGYRLHDMCTLTNDSLDSIILFSDRKGCLNPMENAYCNTTTVLSSLQGTYMELTMQITRGSHISDS